MHREANEASFLTDVSHFSGTAYHDKPGSSTERSPPLISPPPQILSVRSSTHQLSQTPPASPTFTFFKTVAELLHGWLSSHPHLPARQASSHGVADPTRLPLLTSHPVDTGPPQPNLPKACWAHAAASSLLARPARLSFLYPSQWFTWKL